MAFDRKVSCADLGAAAEAATFGLRLAGDEALEWLLGGVIDPWQGRRFEGNEGAKGGLFDERVFGPLLRDAAGGLRLEAWRAVEARDRPQATRFGTLVLPCRVVHPWVLRMAAGEAGETIRALARCEKIVVGDEVVAWTDQEDDPRACFGAEAVAALVKAGALDLDASAFLSRIPVLPAGLRPVIREGERTRVQDLTLLYEMVEDRVCRFARLRELGAPKILLVNETAMLQRAVDALFVDGATRVEDEDDRVRWTPAAPEEEPDLESLRHFLGRSSAWAAEIDVLVRAESRAFSKRWHSPPYFYRAWLEASALELLPLDASGAADLATLARSRLDRAARMFDDAYTLLVGPLWKNVVHGPTDTPPHVDVYATEPLDGGTRLLLTAGMSTLRMFDHPLQGPCVEPFVELAMKVPAGVEDAVLEHLMQGLLALARYPFVHRTHFAAGHDVAVGKPILPGSELSAFVVARAAKEEPFEALSAALPRSPRFLRVLGVTAAERAQLAEGNRGERVDRVFRETRGITDPGRASLV